MRLGDLDVLAPAQRQLQLTAWNDTSRPYPQGLRLHEVFERQASQFADSIIVEHGDVRLTYAQLNGKANQLAHRLIEDGCGAGSMVGIKLERSLQMIIALLAVLKSGAAYVPLDPAYPKARLGHLLRQSGAVTVITSAALADSDDTTLQWVIYDDDQLGGYSEDNPEVVGGELAYVIFTSGSTGLPKGVAGLHGSILNRLQWMWEKYPYAVDEVCCQKTALNFTDSITEIFGPLLSNVPLVLISDAQLKEPLTFLSLVQQKAITRIVLVPSLLKVLLAVGGAVRQQFAGLRLCVVSGEALDGQTRNEFLRLLPHVLLLNLYGSTEVSGDVLFAEVNQMQPVSVPVPIGRPMANVRAYVLDVNMSLLPQGARGELYVAGSNLALGYFADPAATAWSFVPDPFSTVPGQRLFRTGDMARLRADGQIEYLGRRDSQVKVLGMRVGLGEIEECLRQLSGIRDVVIVARSREDGHDLAAYYTLGGPWPDSVSVRRHLLDRLPSHMVPRFLSELETMPLQINGKIDRHALPEPSLALATLDDGVRLPPVGETQVWLCELWSRALGLDTVGIRDDFFMLGGNSLDAMRLVAAINTHWRHVNIGVRDILELRTVEGLCASIESRLALGPENTQSQADEDEEILWVLDDLAQ